MGLQFRNITRFCFGCLSGETVLGKTDLLSKSLQGKSLSAAEGQVLAAEVLKILQCQRTTVMFNSFWEKVMVKTSVLKVEKPSLPRKRKRPGRFEDGDNHHVFTSVKDCYRTKYFDTYDDVINGIEDRFNQPDYVKYAKMESVSLKGFAGKNVDHE